MLSTMMDVQLTITSLMRYGTSAYGDKEVVTWTGDGTRRQSYAETGRRAARLANALRSLGVDGDQRVATLMWNNSEHLEAYLAIPSMGAVLHTLNLRLDPATIGYIATHAGDDVVIADRTLVPLLAQVLPHADRDPARADHRPGVGGGGPGGRRPGRRGHRGALLRGAAGRPAGHVQLARAGREVGRGDVLHERHHRPPQGRGVQPPVVLPALDGRLRGQRVRGVRARQRSCRWCRCSTPTRGAWPTPRCWPVPT